MTSYRVRDGYRFGTSNQHAPGTIVDLTEDEARGFLDKLERVVDEPAPAPEPDPAADDEPRAADDLTAITGIGDATERTLNRMGVFTFAELLTMTNETPHLLRDAIGGITADKVDTWRTEAAALLGQDNG